MNLQKEKSSRADSWDEVRTITVEESRQYFKKFTFEVLTSKPENILEKDSFESTQNQNTLGIYFKENAWNEDLEGETRVYLVKDPEGKTAAFFSIKCGLVLKRNLYDKLDEDERQFVDMVVTAKRANDQETIQSYYEYGDSEFDDIDRLFEIADRRCDTKNETDKMQDADKTLKVEECFSAIELKHFCRNENYFCDKALRVPLGFGIFWEVIVKKILDIVDDVGCKYIYIFAADHSKEPEIKRLVYYYKSAYKFYECDEDDIIIIKPEYDRECYSLVQEIAKLKQNRETVWQEYSDV